MDLFSSPEVVDVLEQIRVNYGLDETIDSGELDRFFWLRAARPAGQAERLRVWPTYRRPSAGTTDVGGHPPVRLCNLVLQGGGTLGLAHAGFVTGLEVAGVRFAGLAGTSAGSILAMGIAAIRGADVTRETYRKLVAITDAVPMDSFIDGPRPLRVLIKRALQGRPIYTPQHWPGLLAALARLRDRRGLNHGTAFETWFESVLLELNCNTINDLYEALDTVWDDLADLRALYPNGPDRDPVLKDLSKVDASLAGRPGTALLHLITMAMPVGLKFKLPQDLYYLSPEYQRTSPARLVRTSMSIPAFFEPVVMRTNRQTWAGRVQSEVSDLLPAGQSEQFEALRELVFLDGGMMSNLPSDSFRELMPEVPTIVVPLVRGGEAKEITRRKRLSALGADAAACASAVRLQRDRETWAQNATLRKAFDQAEENAPDVVSDKRAPRRYPVAIAPIDTGDANWLNFVMSAEDKAILFLTGLRRARDLLKTLKNGNSS